MRNIKNHKGQSLVEFAIILPIILLLLMGMAEFGMMLNSYLAIQNSSREGARLGIVGGTDLQINSVVTATSPSLTSSNLTVLITPLAGSRTSGGTLTVSLNYNYHTTVPIIGAILKNVVVLHAQTSMRIE